MVAIDCEMVGVGAGGKRSMLARASLVDGTGAVAEYTLGNHVAGTQLASTVTVVSNTVTTGTRQVVLRRSLKGESSAYYSFTASAGSCPPPSPNLECSEAQKFLFTLVLKILFFGSAILRIRWCYFRFLVIFTGFRSSFKVIF